MTPQARIQASNRSACHASHLSHIYALQATRVSAHALNGVGWHRPNAAAAAAARAAASSNTSTSVHPEPAGAVDAHHAHEPVPSPALPAPAQEHAVDSSMLTPALQEAHHHIVYAAHAAAAGPLPDVLRSSFPDAFATMTSARKACRRRRVLVDGTLGSCGTPVQTGQLIQIIEPSDQPVAMAHDGAGSSCAAAPAAAASLMRRQRRPRIKQLPNNLSIPILHDDDHITVVVKPWGIKCHGWGSHNLAAYVQSLVPPSTRDGALPGGPHPAHRLDMLTGGIMICAKTRSAAAFLTRQFESRHVRKQYRALVAGRLEQLPGSFPIIVQHPVEGREARTEVAVVSHSRCLRYGGWITTVDLRPLTGRRHQLRRHLALCLGHPILGDSLDTPWAGVRQHDVDVAMAAAPAQLREWAEKGGEGGCPMPAGGRVRSSRSEEGDGVGGDSSNEASSSSSRCEDCGGGYESDNATNSSTSSGGSGRDGSSSSSDGSGGGSQKVAAIELLKGWGMALWAGAVEFDHPATGKRISFSLPEPQRFKKLRAQQEARWNKFYGAL